MQTASFVHGRKGKGHIITYSGDSFCLCVPLSISEVALSLARRKLTYDLHAGDSLIKFFYKIPVVETSTAVGVGADPPCRK